MSGGYVYILASAPNGVLYVGVTNDLVRRIYEHRNGLVAGFTKKYSVKRLVYFEYHEEIQAAIQREHNMKHWSRKWKVRLVLASNPTGMICMIRSHSLERGWPGQARP